MESFDNNKKKNLNVHINSTNPQRNQIQNLEDQEGM
jgi:hypothetical protein